MSVVKQIREPRVDYRVLEEPALLRGFELLAMAEGGLEKLRELILALAVQGRLVSQDSFDEPASSSLMRIRAAKEQLIASEKTKRRATMNHTANVEPTTKLPDGWEWAHLSELVTVLNGRAYAKQEFLDAGTPVLRVGNLFTSKHWYYSNLQLEDDKYCDAGDLLFAWSASFGPFIWAGPKVIYHYHIWKLALHSETEFYKNYLYTFLLKKTQEMKASGHGVSMLHITKEAVEKIAVPVPPLAEQHRIVARVEELMALCDELEARGRLADEQHARLTTTLFDALTASDSAQTLADNWQRIATHFDLLLDRPQAIDALEQTILQLAVRGLLVPQDTSDEPASKLLARIRVEKDRLVTEGKIRRDKPVSPVSDEEKPFEVRPGWEWAPFGTLVNVSSGITLGRKTTPMKPVTLPYLRVANVQRWHLDLDHVKTITVAENELPRFLLEPGDLLLTEGGDWDKVGRTCIWQGDIELCLHQNHLFKARGVLPEWSPAWAELYLNSTDARTFFARASKQTTNLASVNSTQLKSCPFPVPPLAEQHRIVARVEQLRSLCDDLRGRLNKVRATQTHLAETLATEAAQPQRGARLG